MSRKQFYEWEKILKGSANHRRLEILLILKKKSGLSTDDIVQELKCNYQTGAVHVQKLVRSGLVLSYRNGLSVGHKLSELGNRIISLCINL